MVGHGGSSAGSYLADPTSPIPSHCASIVVTSTIRVKTLYDKNVHLLHQLKRLVIHFLHKETAFHLDSSTKNDNISLDHSDRAGN